MAEPEGSREGSPGPNEGEKYSPGFEFRGSNIVRWWLSSAVFKLIFWPNKIMPVPTEPQPSPEAHANIFSRVTFWWLRPLLYTGYFRGLEVEDAWLAPESQSLENRLNQFDNAVKYCIKLYPDSEFIELAAAAWSVRFELIMALVAQILSMTTLVLSAAIGRGIVLETEILFQPNPPSWGRDCGFVIVYTFLILVSVSCNLWVQFQTSSASENVRGVLIGAIQAKALHLGPRGRYHFPESRILSLTATDTLRIAQLAKVFVPALTVLPTLGALIGLLVYYLGVAGLAGLALFVLLCFFNFWATTLQERIRSRVLPLADARVELVREALGQVRAIKLYGWERVVLAAIKSARKEEVKWRGWLAICEAAQRAIMVVSPLLCSIFAFSILTALGHRITTSDAFPSILLFDILIPLSHTVFALFIASSNAFPSIRRLNAFFKSEEVPLEQIPTALGQEAVIVHKAKIGWPGLIVLEKVNFSLERGALMLVVGRVGSGKSTLLRGLAGGAVVTKGSIALSQPVSSVFSNLCLNRTARENVIFGRSWDSVWYAQVLRACALDDDFAKLPEGDETVVGEKGVTLSVGLRARVALARAVYGRPQVLLLDDVLAALDTRVANEIFHDCILTLLKDTTRILCTHNLDLLPYSDKIAYLDSHGGVVVDSFSQHQASHPEFAAVAQSKSTAVPSLAVDSIVDDPTAPEFASDDSSFLSEAVTLEDYPERDATSFSPYTDAYNTDEWPAPRTGLLAATFPAVAASDQPRMNEVECDQTEHIGPPKGPNSGSETKARGQFSEAVKRSFFYADTPSRVIYAALGVMLILIAGGSICLSTVFVELWAEEKFPGLPQGFYIGTTFAILFVAVVSFTLYTVIIDRLGFQTASRLHCLSMSSLLYTPMSYFDTTPIGRILSRLTDDIAVVDTVLPSQIRESHLLSVSIIAAEVAAFFYVPWAAWIAIAHGLFVGFLTYFYGETTRELRRVANILRSTMFTTLTESVIGADLISTFSQEESWRRTLVDQLTATIYSARIEKAAHSWVSLRVLLFATPVTYFVVLFLAIFRIRPLPESAVGLLIVLLPKFSTYLVYSPVSISRTQNNLSSVERLYEYGHQIPQDSYDGEEPPEDWGKEGTIEFEDVTVRYRPDLSPAISQFSAKIKGGERVGICGRTGAGKSTLLNALFRLRGLESGKILIDGIDVSTVPIHNLRKCITVVPQDTVLFKGTVRSNLDPLNEHSDHELWAALRRAAVSTHLNLESAVTADGTNFSLGERQQLALARALLHKSHILVLDEATSAVDLVSDREIQHAIASEFRECTILCVAHRLRTILGYDKIVVISDGRCIEVGTPRQLFETRGSQFSTMCLESGITEMDLTLAAVAQP